MQVVDAAVVSHQSLLHHSASDSTQLPPDTACHLTTTKNIVSTLK